MHINIHYAIGIIIASIKHLFFQFTLFEFFVIVLSAFIIDFDVIFSKYGKDHNHRNLITHSIWPSGLVLILGIILFNLVLTICGITLIIHILIDTFDWGTNFFYSGKTLGLKLLISPEEEKNMKEILSKYKIAHSYFAFKYYNNRGCKIVEILVCILMLVTNLIFASEFWYFLFFYFIFLGFHLYGYKKLKEIENH